MRQMPESTDEEFTTRQHKQPSYTYRVNMPTSPDSAKAIAEDLLQRTGNALIGGDFAAFIDCFFLPHSVITASGENVLKTAANAERVFDNVREYHKRLGVTEIVRHSLAAAFSDPETIKATHETRLLSYNRLVEDPYPVFSVLKKIDGKWYGVSSEYAIPAAAESLSIALNPKGDE